MTLGDKYKIRFIKADFVLVRKLEAGRCELLRVFKTFYYSSLSMLNLLADSKKINLIGLKDLLGFVYSENICNLFPNKNSTG